MNVEELTLLVSMLRDAQEKVDSLDAQMKRAKESVRRLEEETIPCAMQEMGVGELKLTDGTKVSVKDDVYVAIPKANQDAAYEWLAKMGHQGLIKIDVVAHFTKGSQEEAAALALRLEEEGFSFAMEQSVHAQTMKAFLREQLKAGANVPLDLFGARPVNVTKISTPKRK